MIKGGGRTATGHATALCDVLCRIVQTLPELASLRLLSLIHDLYNLELDPQQVCLRGPSCTGSWAQVGAKQSGVTNVGKARGCGCIFWPEPNRAASSRPLQPADWATCFQAARKLVRGAIDCPALAVLFVAAGLLPLLLEDVARLARLGTPELLAEVSVTQRV